MFSRGRLSSINRDAPIKGEGGTTFKEVQFNKRGCSNKRGWRNNIQKLIKGEPLIRVSSVEFSPQIKKRASPFIREVRVLFGFLWKCQVLQALLSTVVKRAAEYLPQFFCTKYKNLLDVVY